MAQLARAAGFPQVSVSHEISPLMRLVSRGETTVVDAYLSPILRGYVDGVARQLGPVRLRFMQSHGGLTDAHLFRGKDSILSGPAGGIVGAVETCRRAGFERLVTFDMGGTSTDVAHYAGEYERSYESVVGGVRLRAPMLRIHTVAAGGGSVCAFEDGRYRVGPRSAGADPGPACYGKGGPLAVTDCNVVVGKLQPSFFPRVFGADGAGGIDAEAARQALAAVAASLRAAGLDPPAPEQLADDFIRVACDTMARAIKRISTQRGHDITRATLCCFGGAAGQHACLVADALGMDSVLLHPLAGVLSAYGMGLADVRALRERTVEAPLESAAPASSGGRRSARTDRRPGGAGGGGRGGADEAGIHGSPDRSRAPRARQVPGHRRRTGGAVGRRRHDGGGIHGSAPQPLRIPDARPAPRDRRALRRSCGAGRRPRPGGGWRRPGGGRGRTGRHARSPRARPDVHGRRLARRPRVRARRATARRAPQRAGDRLRAHEHHRGRAGMAGRGAGRRRAPPAAQLAGGHSLGRPGSSARRCSSRCSTTCSCRSPSRWARPSSTPPAR